MGIISSIITENLLQKDGRRDITEVHTDHLGIKHFVRWTANQGVDIKAQMLYRIPSIEAELIEQETNDIISKVKAGVDFKSIVFNFVTKDQILTKLKDSIQMELDQSAEKVATLTQIKGAMDKEKG